MIRKDNLKVYYKLNGSKSSDGKILDFSGNGNHGTLTGTEVYTKTQLGKEMFDFISGNRSSITVPNTTSCCSGDVTVMCKVRVGDNILQTQSFFSKGAGTETTILFDLVANSFRAVSYAATGVLTYITHSAIPYKDQDVIGTFVRDGEVMKLYINKTLVGTRASSLPFINNNNITVGSRGGGTFSLSPQSDFMMWEGIALTQTEIAQAIDYINTPPEFSPKMTPSLTSDGVDDYIDTGVVPDFTTVIEFQSRIVAGANNRTILGSYHISNTNERCMLYEDASNNITYIGAGGSSVIVTPKNNLVYTFIINNINNTVTANGVVTNVNNTGLNATRTIKIAGGEVGINSSNSQYYYVKIWKAGQLIRHMIPQKDGTFIDVVNNVVYSNSGTGTLTYKQESLVIEDDLLFYTRDGVRDLTGRNTITNNGAIVGKGMEFNGSTSRLDLGADILGTKTITVEAVINPDTFGVGSYGRIVDDGKFMFYLNNIFRVKTITLTSTGSVGLPSPDNSIIEGRNYHVVGVRRSNGTGAIYINGVLVVSGDTGTPDAATFNTCIGDTLKPALYRNFDGKINMVKIYERELTADEVYQKYLKEVRYW